MRWLLTKFLRQRMAIIFCRTWNHGLAWVFSKMREPEAEIWAMKFDKKEIQLARAKYRVSQAALTKDEEIKKFWDDLADGWLDIDAGARREVWRANHNPSQAGQSSGISND